jgi:Flp pilus assembly protein TadD
MRTYILSAGMFAIIVASLTGNAWGQTSGDTKQSLPGMGVEGASIDGRVVLPSGRSVSVMIKVTVEVGGSAIKTVYTDSTGVFHIRGINGGLVSVRAYGDERFYIPGNQDVNLQPGANVQLTIYLREKTRSSADNNVPGVISADDFDRLAPSNARKAYDKAEKMIEKGETDAGISQLKEAVGFYSDYASARNALGVQYLKRKQLPEASQQFEYILSKAPKYFEARFNLGLVRLEQQRYKDAVAELAAATSIDSSKAVCHMWLGVAYLQTSDFAHAEQEMNRAQAFGGQQLPATHYYMGQIYLRQNRVNDACKEFQEYVAQFPMGDLASDSRRILQKCPAK